MEILFFEFLITPRCTKTLKEKFDFVEMEWKKLLTFGPTLPIIEKMKFLPAVTFKAWDKKNILL